MCETVKEGTQAIKQEQNNRKKDRKIRMQIKLILKHRYQNSKYNSNKWNSAIFTGKIDF